MFPGRRDRGRRSARGRREYNLAGEDRPSADVRRCSRGRSTRASPAALMPVVRPEFAQRHLRSLVEPGRRCCVQQQLPAQGDDGMAGPNFDRRSLRTRKRLGATVGCDPALTFARVDALSSAAWAGFPGAARGPRS